MSFNPDILAAGTGLLNTAYNLYTNKRDFDYQKALQQQMFEREDTAVQRRMNDLQAAGLNPSLANGQGAGAGAVVSRSNTNDVNMGSALDMLQAVNNIRQQKQAVQNAKIEEQILKDQEYIKDNEKYISMAQTLTSLGIPFSSHVYNNSDGKFNMWVGLDNNNFKKGHSYNIPGNISNIQKIMDYQMSQLKNSADILQKDNDYYTADKITGYLSTLLPNIGFSFGKRFK